MARSRFVDPDVVRLPLSDGEWVEVKRELNAGEARKVFANLVTRMEVGEKAQLDPAQVGKTKLVQYIVAWSFSNKQGPVKYSEADIDNLDQDTYRELVEAIDKHDEASERLREERKNAQAGASPSPAILQSVNG